MTYTGDSSPIGGGAAVGMFSSVNLQVSWVVAKKRGAFEIGQKIVQKESQAMKKETIEPSIYMVRRMSLSHSIICGPKGIPPRTL
eukprot:1338751-Amorphochlora_amoeboformis.AAC.3